MQIFVNTKYDFVKWRFVAVAFSIVWVLIGLALFMKRGINWGIDFAGGANIVLKFSDHVPMDRLRADLRDASIQQYGKAEENNVLNPPAASGKIDINFHGRDVLTELLTAADPDNKGTRPEARQYYANVAQAIISKRSDL